MNNYQVLILVLIFSFFTFIRANSEESPKRYVSTVGAVYVEPSGNRILQPGQKILNLFKRSMMQGHILQRLSEKTYWVSTGFYNSIFYVGKEGVIVFDPLSGGLGNNVRRAIGSVTELPITAVVYSHYHADHIGDVQVFIDKAKEDNVSLRIIATDKTTQKMKYLNSKLPMPNEEVKFNNGKIVFEDLEVEVIGFKHAFHTDDHAAFYLNKESIMHVPDLLNPDQIPFLDFGGSENFVYYKKNLELINSFDWKFFSGGHGNIGDHLDFKFMLNYLQDLEIAGENTLKHIKFDEFVKPEHGNHHRFADLFYEQAKKKFVDYLRPKYGQVYGFEASAPYQAEMVLNSIISYK